MYSKILELKKNNSLKIIVISFSVLFLCSANLIKINKINSNNITNFEESDTLKTSAYNDNIGFPICIDDQYMSNPKSCSDGQGGIIVVWDDSRNFSINRYDVYAQRVNGSGDIQWAENGVPISTEVEDQDCVEICSDGQGGAYIVWHDCRELPTDPVDIYVQRVDSSGNIQWAENGIPICSAENAQVGHEILSDGHDGIIIIWEDMRNGQFDLYAQRVNASGDFQWAENGIPICTEGHFQFNPNIYYDNAHNYTFVWQDDRNGESDIYTQRVNASGDIQWAENGIPICSADGDQTTPEICKANSGEVIIVWKDSRNSENEIYAQNINNLGISLWEPNGTSLFPDKNGLSYPKICSNGENGAIITCYNNNGNNLEICAQKIDHKGDIQWGYGGIPICTVDENENFIDIYSYNNKEAIIIWDDSRNGEDNTDIYTQWINENGDLYWEEDGKAICNVSNNQENPHISLIHNSIDIFAVWQDYRNGNFDIYGRRINMTFQDTYAPIWYPKPTNKTIESDIQFNYKVSAKDISGIDQYWINDTIHFEINSTTGLITNKTMLSLGQYWLKISVNDTLGYVNSKVIKITVRSPIAPSWNPEPVNQDIKINVAFSYDVNAEDINGIDQYWINDTIHFEINSTTGLITNKTMLLLGQYWLKISVNDTLGHVNSISIKIMVYIYYEKVFFDDFENGLSKWSEITGLWHLANESSDWSDPYHSPTHSMWFGNEETGNYNTGDRVIGNITTIPFSLIDMENVYLTFYYWKETEGFSFVDLSTVYISIDGISWDLLYTSADVLPWQKVSIDISNYVGNPLVQVRFNFDSIDRFGNNYRGWYIDDLEVLGIETKKAPSWNPIPTNQTIELGDTFSYDVHAEDCLGIDHYWINDTIHFQIDSNTGEITNNTILQVRNYWLLISVNDTVSYINNTKIQVIVQDTKSPTWNPNPTDQTIELGNNFSYTILAQDLSGIDQYWINDTIHFQIDPNTGEITNNAVLQVRNYWLLISVNDTQGNTNNIVIKINVFENEGENGKSIPGFPLMIFMIIFFIGIIGTSYISKKIFIFEL